MNNFRSTPCNYIVVDEIENYKTDTTENNLILIHTHENENTIVEFYKHKKLNLSAVTIIHKDGKSIIDHFINKNQHKLYPIDK